MALGQTTQLETLARQIGVAMVAQSIDQGAHVPSDGLGKTYKLTMFQEVLLHIGMPKTGTTSIQEALAQAADQLAVHDILFPRFPGVASSGGNHSMPMRWLSGFSRDIPFGRTADYMDVKGARETWNQVKGSNHMKLMISGEAICRLPMENLLSLKQELSEVMTENGTIRILLLVRNPISLYVSWRNEYYKNLMSDAEIASLIGPSESEQDMRLDDIVTKLKATFPDAEYTFGKFEEWAADDGLLTAFEKWADLPFPLPRLKTNETISWEVGKLYERAKRASLPLSTHQLNGLAGSPSGVIPDKDEETVAYFNRQIKKLCEDMNLPMYDLDIGFKNLFSRELWPPDFFHQLRAKLKSLPADDQRKIWKEIRAICNEEGEAWHASVKRRLRWETWKRNIWP